jgi:hypothetical protein
MTNGKQMDNTKYFASPNLADPGPREYCWPWFRRQENFGWRWLWTPWTYRFGHAGWIYLQVAWLWRFRHGLSGKP